MSADLKESCSTDLSWLVQAETAIRRAARGGLLSGTQLVAVASVLRGGGRLRSAVNTVVGQAAKDGRPAELLQPLAAVTKVGTPPCVCCNTSAVHAMWAALPGQPTDALLHASMQIPAVFQGSETAAVCMMMTQGAQAQHMEPCAAGRHSGQSGGWRH